jgi:general stress protein 26
MFTTRHGNGHLHARPMTTQNGKIDEDSSLWFFMSEVGDVVKDIAAEPAVAVVYADTNCRRLRVGVRTGAVVDDMAKKQQLWNTMTEAWFPAGQRPRRCPGAGEHHPRGLLGSEGQQAHPAVQDGQGGGHRASAD